ncbi:MAG: SAM-dependent methyltransferase [Candidatus Micrarchaeia archaeon]
MAVTYGRLVIDSENAAWLNKCYYNDNCSIDFITEAMGTRYQQAFARYLYNRIDEKKMSSVRILEVGARGIYFESGIARELSLLDARHGTRYSEGIVYGLLDVSQVAIDAAKEEYETNSDAFEIFNTRFYTMDATKGLPNGFDIIVMNELLDDMPHIVAVKKDNAVYEVLYKISMGDGVCQSTVLERHGLRKINKSMLRNNEFLACIDNGEATTYSEYIPKIISNAARSIEGQGLLFIHDYGIKSKVSIGVAGKLRRLYGGWMPDMVYRSVESPVQVQITTDINWALVLRSLEMHGFSTEIAEYHDVFVNEMLGNRIVSFESLAYGLNSMNIKEKRALLKKLGIEDKEEKGVNAALASGINRLLSSNAISFKGSFRSSSSASVNLRYKVASDDKMNALYDVYKRGSAEVNPTMDIAAVKRQ